MYQPTLGRFLSRDPLSENGVDVLTDTGFFSDRLAAMRANPSFYGGNREHPYVYARNNPLRYVDPSGMLTVKPLGSSLRPSCGQRAWIRWDFVLDKKAPCDGYLVQQIDTRCTIKDCVDCPRTSPVRPDFTFWEAFFVRNKETLEEARVLGQYSFTDESRPTALDEKCGNRSAIGTIKFFCMTTTGDLGKFSKPNPKSGWRINARYGEGDCQVRTGPLPSTDTKPRWWDDAPIESASRWTSLFWCCCDDKTNFVHADANPK
jgi:RHS repeat-associated protein